VKLINSGISERGRLVGPAPAMLGHDVVWRQTTTWQNSVHIANTVYATFLRAKVAFAFSAS